MTHAAPGIHKLDDPEYFAHPALSHSDCKLILESPAKYDHYRRHPADAKKPTDDMQFGSAVHAITLGGPKVIEVAADSWRTNAAKQARTEIEADGNIPLLTDDAARAHECAAAIRQHPVARKLIDAADETEIVAIWDDNDVQRRAKLDLRSGRFGVDLKTTYDAGTDDFARSAAKYGYWTQAPYYMDALRACWGIDDPKFLFIAVEKQPPYLVNVIEFDPYDIELGARRNRRAIDLYRHCRTTGIWPGFGDGINTATLPRWVAIEEETA